MSSTSRTSSRRAALTLAAIVATLVFGVAVATSAASVPQKAAAANPDDGLTDSEKIAAHDANTAKFWAHYEEWLAELDTSRDLRSYPVGELLVSSRAGASSLPEAISSAQEIVLGRVDSVEFQIGPAALVHVRIDETLKGGLKSAVIIAIPCMMTPSDEWSAATATIACAQAVPMLYPKDQVVLLLERDDDAKPFSVQPWTGIYWIDGESLKTVEGNAFESIIQMMTPRQLSEAIKG